ncbi:MAG: transcriptional regulator [Gammaproteobacteria bacterium]|jgi:hypothetical protein
MSDEEYAVFKWYLVLNPDVGDLVSGTGGVRKVRWAPAQTGKRGGLRIIYYYRPNLSEIWMLTIYSKTRKNDLTTRDKDALRQIIKEIKK